MAASTVQILDAQPTHEAGWRTLWAEYCSPGGLDPRITDATWRRICDPASALGCQVAILEDKLVGFVTYVLHECSWEAEPVCYVEDVFVDKRARGDARGIGVALANAMLERFRQQGWSRLYGITHPDNHVAQRLYGRFAEGTPYLRYALRQSA